MRTDAVAYYPGAREMDLWRELVERWRALAGWARAGCIAAASLLVLFITLGLALPPIVSRAVAARVSARGLTAEVGRVRLGWGRIWLIDVALSDPELPATRAHLDAVALTPGQGDLAARMGRFEVLAVVAVAGDRVQDHAGAMLRRVSGLPVEKQARLVVGAAEMRGGGCLVRVAGTSVEDVAREVRACLEFLPALLGDDPWARKW